MTSRIVPVGDHALLVEFDTNVTDAARHAVQALDQAIATAPPAGVIETVPAYASLLVDFDPLTTDHTAVAAALARHLDGAAVRRRHADTHHVDLTVGNDVAPDLPAVAATVGLRPEDVIGRFCAATYEVAMYGFAPGYAYLAGVPAEIQVPRKPAPVRDVPAGSVLIAGPQCLITTLPMPTGWSIIGHSPTPTLTDDPSRPFRLALGDHVRFNPTEAR